MHVSGRCPEAGDAAIRTAAFVISSLADPISAMATHSIVKVFSPAEDVPEVYMFWDGVRWNVSAEGMDSLFRFRGPEALTAASAAFHTDQGTLLRVKIEQPGANSCWALDLWFPHEGKPGLAGFYENCPPALALVGLGPSRTVRLGRWVLSAVETGGERIEPFDPERRSKAGPEADLWPDLGWNEIHPGLLYRSSVVGGRRLDFFSYEVKGLKASLLIPGNLCRVSAVAVDAPEKAYEICDSASTDN